MKRYLISLLVLLSIIPNITFGAQFFSQWFSNTTTTPIISPQRISNSDPALKFTNFTASSTTATSSIAFNLFVGTNPGIITTAISNLISNADAPTNGNFILAGSHGSSVSSASAGFSSFSSRGTSASPTASQLGDTLYVSGGRGFGATIYGSNSKGAVLVSASQNWTDSNQGAYLTLETTPNNSTTRAERVRVDQNGNVGVGTTSPYATLSVVGASGVVADHYNATGTVASTFQYASSTALTVSGNAYMPGSGIWNSSGNVGIGTVTPGASTALNVNGMGLFTGGTVNPSDGTSAGVSIGFSGGTGFIQAVQTGSAWKDLWIQSSGGSNGNTILNGQGTGNTGVGTTTPSAKFAITGLAGLWPFYISTTTAIGASTTLFAIDSAGDVHYGGGVPTPSGCGTNPSLGPNSTDQVGTVTVGATGTGCTLTWSTAKQSASHCQLTQKTMSLVNALSITVETASTFTFTQVGAAGASYNYFCPLGH